MNAIAKLPLADEIPDYEEMLKLNRSRMQAFTARNASELQRRRTNSNLLGFGGLGVVVVAVAAAILFTDEPGFAIAIIAFFGLFGFAFWMASSQVLTLLTEKVGFVNGLCEALMDELAPESRLKLTWDPADFDEERKLVRTAQSLAGNQKRYLKDRWLKLKFVLADGTRVKMTRQRNVKTKKGAELRTHRRIRLQVLPGSRYEMLMHPDLQDLEEKLRETVRFEFHDPPEFFRVKTEGSDGAIDIHLHQWDAEFLVEEVLAILGAVVGFLDTRRATTDSQPDGAW